MELHLRKRITLLVAPFLLLLQSDWTSGDVVPSIAPAANLSADQNLVLDALAQVVNILGMNMKMTIEHNKTAKSPFGNWSGGTTPRPRYRYNQTNTNDHKLENVANGGRGDHYFVTRNKNNHRSQTENGHIHEHDHEHTQRSNHSDPDFVTGHHHRSRTFNTDANGHLSEIQHSHEHEHSDTNKTGAQYVHSARTQSKNVDWFGHYNDHKSSMTTRFHDWKLPTNDFEYTHRFGDENFGDNKITLKSKAIPLVSVLEGLFGMKSEDEDSNSTRPGELISGFNKTALLLALGSDKVKLPPIPLLGGGEEGHQSPPPTYGEEVGSNRPPPSPPFEQKEDTTPPHPQPERSTFPPPGEPYSSSSSEENSNEGGEVKESTTPSNNDEVVE